MARLFILLIIVAAFAIWAGFALRDIDRRYSSIAFIVGALLALLAAGGFFGFL
ncbi:MAG: hypothetical protein SV201_14865 [Pseudomonadota bacterium]|nr:hypothetical protein [Pseudomonadota bacterium]